MDDVVVLVVVIFAYTICMMGGLYDLTSAYFYLPFFLYLSLDAIVHVVRCFEDEDVIHVDGTGKF